MISASSENSNLQIQRHRQGETNKTMPFGFVTGVLSSPAVTNGLSYIQSNPVVETFSLDLTTMIIPRTYINTKQNPDYGRETFINELVPVIFNPFGPGIVAGIMMKAKGYGGISAGVNPLNSLHHAWNTAGGKNFSQKEKKPEILKNYYKNVYRNVTGNSINNKFTPLSEEHLDELAKLHIDLHGDKTKKEIKATRKKIAEYFTEHTGFSNNLDVKIKDGHHFSTDIHTLSDDAVSVGKKLFTQKAPEQLEQAVKDIIKFSKAKSLWAAGLSIAGIVTIPAINNAITKAKTGSSAACIYKDFGKSDAAAEEDGKKGLLGAKALGIGVIASVMLATMGAFSRKPDKGFFVKNGLKNFVNTIELKGKSAHMDLIKLVYGFSLMSRIVNARDKQEVQTSTIKDTCSFMNWLVLGAFVTKGVAHLASRKGFSYVNITAPIKDTTGKNAFTRALKTVGNWLDPGKVSFRSLSEMKAMGASRKQLAIHTASILAGLGWSMLALGIGIPVLNNTMNNKARKKQIEALSLRNSATHADSLSLKSASQSSQSFSNSPSAAAVHSLGMYRDFINKRRMAMSA